MPDHSKDTRETEYPSGDHNHNTYDAFGNRETQSKSVLGLVTNDTYVYDDANRLTGVNAVNYTWDNNGNLLNDGVNTYTYDFANRLQTLSGGGNNVTYSYNGLGDRLRETVNGNPTTFTMDLNAGLTQALSDGTKAYIYGNGRIAQAGTGTEYFLGDALGSVRQMTNAGSTITYANTYDPYGVVTTTSGTSQTPYGYTSEYSSNNLVYLRARMYAPGMGRFLTRDTWAGNEYGPLSYNKWQYVDSNPSNLKDPTGHSLFDGVCMSQVFSFGLSLNMSAESLVNHCKDFYSQSFWSSVGAPGGLGPYNCNDLNQMDYKKPTTAGELFGDYICERGPDHVYFNGTDSLTHKLARSVALNAVRKTFYKNGGTIMPNHEEKFGSVRLYLNEWKDLVVDPEFPLVHLLGSFWISVNTTVGDRISFKVENRTDLASGTHFIGRFPPPGQESTPYSLQDYIKDHPEDSTKSAAWIINAHPEIVSILDPLLRSQTATGMGGGNFEQTWTWSERDLGCWASLPWPVYLYWPGLDIDNDVQLTSAP